MEEIEQLVIKKIKYYRHTYREASENGQNSLKGMCGRKIKKLTKILEIL